MSDFDETVRNILNQESHACCCMGPRNGEPVCPCAMKHVKIVDGHYVQIISLGEVSKFDNGYGYNGVSLILTDHNGAVRVMQVIRQWDSTISLEEAKRMVSNTPCVIFKDLSRERANVLKELIENAGGYITEMT